MKITRCKLSKNTQYKLLQSFIAEVTAKTAADLAGINRQTAILFYQKIRKKIVPDSVVYTDCYHSYNALDVSEFYHHRINHSTHFAEQKFNHINGIEIFWNQAKRVLRKYNGIPKSSFPLFLKECEFRFNYGTPKQQLTILKKWCF